jgi:alkanesulfonate monooxygenase SsuD/methylene tetrahydromethanopterin reductase-like flavin-dependent oxidoreductase (luciferase family)
MQFGLFFEWPNPELRDWQRLFEEGIEQIQLAEELGFDFILIAEHHFSNYGMSPAPLMQALAVADRTKHIRIGTAVLVLPMWQPLRLAEEVAVLDNLTNGRFFCGIGRGYQPHEFARLGVTSEESRVRFAESLDVLLKAWTSDTSFTYDGHFVKVPHGVVVWPKPKQKPHPPLMLAGTSQDSLELAAERDFTLLTSGFAGPAVIRRTTRELLRLRTAAGRPVDTWGLGAQTYCHVAESNDEARSLMRYPQWQLRANRSLQRADVIDGRANAIPFEGERYDEDFWDGLFYGDPDRLIAKYRDLAEAGCTFASCWMMSGGMPHEKLMRSVRLMGQEVIPALRDVHPPAELALLHQEA